MDREEFEKLANDNKASMIFVMGNWEVDTKMVPTHPDFILVNTMKLYVKALREKDDKLASACIDKFNELNKVFIN